MVKRGKRKINNNTARKMITWSHYKFKQILKAKSKRYGCEVFDCDEHYTSKICTHCGNANEKLGGKKDFICKNCNIQMDRDFNGARNILIKFIYKYHK
jgi:putative transposase